MNPKFRYPQTPESIRETFLTHGVCAAEWARSMGFPAQTMKDLLRGKARGVRGVTHHAAVALGLKPDPNQRTEDRKQRTERPLAALCNQ
jgi:gp16 family phage-associated protein